jgi:hypothetical protein
VAAGNRMSVWDAVRSNGSQLRASVRYASCAWAEDFVFAGSSAALLLIVRLHRGYWYLSFLALCPLIFKASRSSSWGALRAGMFFGAARLLTSEIDRLVSQPESAASDILSGIALCSLLGWSIGWSQRHWGGNPWIVSLIWLGFQFFTTKLAGAVSVFEYAGLALPLVHSMSIALGSSLVSPIIVLANSMLLHIAEEAFALARVPVSNSADDADDTRLDQHAGVVINIVSSVSANRAPPCVTPHRYSTRVAESAALCVFVSL